MHSVPLAVNRVCLAYWWFT